MDGKHRNLLRSCRMSLCRDMDGELVASHLYSEGIISSKDMDYISVEATPFKKNEKLLDILPKRGPKAFFVFCDVLKSVHPHSEVLLQFGLHAPSEGNEPMAKKEAKEERLPQDAEEGAGDDNQDGKWLGGKTKGFPHSQPSQFPQLGDKSTALASIDSDTFYPMEKFPRGFMVIINNKDFVPPSNMEQYPRNGTDVDAEALEKLFVELGFDVQPYRNSTCYEIRRILKQASVMNFAQTNCFVCAILSHGQEGVIYGTDGTIEIRELTGYFRGDKLAGKPKIFIFQACQGSEYMDCVDVIDAPVDEKGNDVTLPTESDFLYAYSTVPGYYSWRNSARGSWFIQAIVEIFRENAHKMDILRMLTRVNGIVSTKKSATGQNYSNNKRQISSIITQLRKEFYFFPPNGPLKSS